MEKKNLLHWVTLCILPEPLALTELKQYHHSQKTQLVVSTRSQHVESGKKDSRVYNGCLFRSSTWHGHVAFGSC